MENIKTTYMPVGQAVRVKYKEIKLVRWIKQNKWMLAISGAFLVLLSIYAVLIVNFVHLIKIIK